MCERCEGGAGRRIEVTDETYGLMIHETTHVALQAAAAHSNQWFDAAKGFLSDMSATWGSQGVVRMAYVWGAARYFLPSPPDRLATPGHEEVASLTRRMTGEEPSPETVARLVAQGDQVDAASTRIAEAASKGEVGQMVETMRDFAESGGQTAVNALLLSLLADAGIRLRHSRDIGDDLSYDLFQAHVQADMPQEESDDKGEDSHGST